MISRWITVGLLAILVACASVEGTSVTIDDTNKHLLHGTWVGEYKAVGGITGIVRDSQSVTVVIDDASSGGSTKWRVADGKVILNRGLGDRMYILSRAGDGATFASKALSSSLETKVLAARIGPIVWELDGPMPMVKRSKTLMDISVRSRKKSINIGLPPIRERYQLQ